MASGGLFGVGIGNGFLQSRFAASESDLVFGLVSEEMGVIVAFTLAVAVGAMFIYARAITTRSRNLFLLFNFSVLCGRTFCRSAFSPMFSVQPMSFRLQA